MTPMLTGMWTSDADRERVLAGTPDQFRIGIPLGRIAEPGDIASAMSSCSRMRPGTSPSTTYGSTAETTLDM